MDKNIIVLIGIVGALFFLFQQNRVEIVINSPTPTTTPTRVSAPTSNPASNSSVSVEPTWTPFYVSQPSGAVVPTITPTGVSLNEALGSSQNPFLGSVTIVP